MCLKSRSVISPVSLSQSLSHSPFSWPSPPSFPLLLQRASFQSSPQKRFTQNHPGCQQGLAVGPSFNHNPKKDVPTLTVSQATSFPPQKKTIHRSSYSPHPPHPQGTGKGLFGKVAFGVNGHYCNLLPVDQFWRPNFTLRGFHQRCTKILKSKGTRPDQHPNVHTIEPFIFFLADWWFSMLCMHCMSMIVNSYNIIIIICNIYNIYIYIICVEIYDIILISTPEVAWFSQLPLWQLPWLHYFFEASLGLVHTAHTICSLS